MNIPGEISCT